MLTAAPTVLKIPMGSPAISVLWKPSAMEVVSTVTTPTTSIHLLSVIFWSFSDMLCEQQFGEMVCAGVEFMDPLGGQDGA